MLPRYPGWFSTTFLGTNFFQSDPHMVGNGDLVGFRPVLVRPTSFSPKLHNLFTVCVLANRTPRGGKSRNIGILGPVGLGQPLALREIPGRNRKNTISRC